MKLSTLSSKFLNFINMFLTFGLNLIDFPKSNSIDDEFDVFNKKKILIVGSGPSLKRISTEVINKYDYIFAINYAIEYLSKFELKNLYLFSCDTNVIYKIFNSNRSFQYKTILIPQQTYSAIKLLKLGLKKNISIIWPNFEFVKYKSKTFNITLPLLRVKIAKKKELINWLVKNNSTFNLGLMPHSSFFTLVALLIKKGVVKIGTIGIDFSKENSPMIGKKYKSSTHGDKEPRAYYKFFEEEVLNIFTDYIKY